MSIITLSIPEKRKAVLIGKNGSVKSLIEKRTKTKIRIDNGVEIEGENPLVARDVVQAIGRGFEPEKALLLLNERFCFEIISLEGESENTRKRLFARIIGRAGKIKSFIEKTTGVYISVYGKTVCIIGEWERAGLAKRAVEILLEGKQFSAMKRYLKREMGGVI